MNKELDALNKIKKIEIYKEEDYYDPDDERTIGLSGYEYQGTVEEEYANEIDIIEKSLKALEIIKEKRIDIFGLICCMKLNEYTALETYNLKENCHNYFLTRDEYDLLKEVLL